LQEAMNQYDGTIMVVSHNRYFVDSFVNKVLEVKNGQVTMYEGNVAEYLDKLAAMEREKTDNRKRADQQEAGQRENSSSTTPKGNRKEKRKQEALKRQERSRKIGPYKKQLAEAEEKVESLEAKKEELEQRMADPELYQDEQAWVKT